MNCSQAAKHALLRRQVAAFPAPHGSAPPPYACVRWERAGPCSERRLLGSASPVGLLTTLTLNSFVPPFPPVGCVQITFKEDFGTQGRGGYFDSFGEAPPMLQPLPASRQGGSSFTNQPLREPRSPGSVAQQIPHCTLIHHPGSCLQASSEM